MNHGGKRARIALLAGVGALVAGAVGAGLGATDASADAPPQRVLQAINVDLGDDGTLYGIKGVTVRKSDGAKTRTSKHTYDPSKTSSDLPVRVLTSYRTATGAGTDLHDLKGYTGKVQIDLTVQNTTVRPRQLSYDANGSARSAYALVGQPLTVVASTDLGAGTVSRVVTHADSGDVTNGVVSRADDGHGVVQWASVLAPPQLDASTTFTLVMNAKDFSLPALDLSVQPGLVTDPSMSALIHSAFGADGGGQLKLQTQTIALIGKVTGVLAQANDQLGDVRRQLAFSAGTLGDRTVGDLAAGTQNLDASTTSLAGSLQSLASSLASSLQQSQSSTVQALHDAVVKVQKRLGDPDTPAQPATVTLNGCQTTVAPKGSRASVHDQLNLVVSRLRGLATAAGTCRDDIRGQIIDSLGTLNGSNAANCPPPGSPATPSVLCVIQGARDSVSGLTTTFTASFALASAAVAQVSTAATSTKLDALIAAITDLQAKKAAVANGGAGGVVGLLIAAGDVRNKLGLLVTDNQSALRSTLDEVHGAATDVQAKLVSNPDSMVAETHALHALICTTATAHGLDQTTEVEPMLRLADGLDCSGNPIPGADATSLAGRLQESSDSLQTVVDDTAPGGAAYQKIADLSTTLDGLKTELDTALVGPGTKLQELMDAIDALYDATAVVPTDCTQLANADPTDFDRVNQVVLELRRIGCHVSTANVALAAADAAAHTNVTSGVGSIQDSLTAVQGASNGATGKVDGYFAKASAPLISAATDLATSSKTSIKSADAAMAADTSSVGRNLSAALTQSLHQVDGNVSSSTRDLKAAGAMLEQDLTNVLTDLGSRSKQGTGLLGIVGAQAAQTRTSAAHVAAAGATASSFGNVRGQDVQGILLRSAQLTSALNLQATAPPFALKLPNGSQHVTVYSFHLREVR